MSDVTAKADWEDKYEMEAEYDFSNAAPNPFAQRAAATRVVELEEDVQVVFPDSQAVNEALRLLIKTALSAKELHKAS